jgi:hypothetical protein
MKEHNFQNHEEKKQVGDHLERKVLLKDILKIKEIKELQVNNEDII